MDLATLQITAQAYLDDKPMGGQVFEMEVDSDAFLKDEEKSKAVIRELLKEYSDSTDKKYVFVSHELILRKPIKLDGQEFAKRLTSQEE